MVKFLRFILFSVLPAVLLAAAALPLSSVSAQDAPPATPPDLWASQGMHAKYVEVRWTGVDGAFYYLVTRTEPGGDTWVKRVTKKTAFDDHRTKPGIVYQYQIQACDKQGCSLPSAPVDGWAGACVSLPAPGLIYPADGEVVYIDPDQSWIRLHWEVVAGAGMYQIQVIDGGSGQILLDQTSHDTYHTVYLEDGDYRWRVRALNDAEYDCPGQWSGIWPFTWVERTPPPAPTNVAASQGTYPDRVVITWDQPGSDPTDYEHYVLRSEDKDGQYTQIHHTSSGPYLFEDLQIEAGKVYFYLVRVCEPGGACNLSEAASGWAGACMGLPAPGLIYPADGEVVRNNPDLGEVQLHWESMAGADMYQIQVMDADSGQILFDETSHDTYHTLNYLADGDYRWRVRALDDANEGCPGQWSVIWSFTSLAYPPPPAPVNVQASQGTYPDKIIITWDQPQGETPAYDHYVLRYESLDGDYLHFYASGSTYEDLQVEPGKRYYYRVEACHPSRGCSLSDPATGWAGDLP